MEKNTPNNNLANQKGKEEKKDIRGILSHVMSTGKGCLLSCITIVVLGVGLFWWLNSSNKVSVDADQKNRDNANNRYNRYKTSDNGSSLLSMTKNL